MLPNTFRFPPRYIDVTIFYVCYGGKGENLEKAE